MQDEQQDGKLPKHVYRTGTGFSAKVRVGGVLKRGRVRATVAEAEEEAKTFKQEQRIAKIERKRQRASDVASTREEHAKELDANMEKHGDSQAKDGRSRDLVKLALEGSDVVVVDGVEYSHDLHLCLRADDLGFDPELDVELDDDVPTLVVELKSTSWLRPNDGKMDNPRLKFQGVHYGDERATLVVMLYIPEDVQEVTRESLAKVRFWYQHAFSWRPKNGVYEPTLYGGNDASGRAIPGHLLGEKLASELRRMSRLSGLIRYGDRSRVFKSETTRIGQRAIDAFEMQVLLPQGACFIPPESGLEGDAIDRRIQFNSGAVKTAQVKHVHVPAGQAGFYTNLFRRNGRFTKDGNSVDKLRPYSVADKIDLFIFVILDGDGNMAEYWAATTADMLGNDPSESLITDGDRAYGVTGIHIHPNLEDKARLGDLVENGDQDAGAVRTRQWIQSLGPIENPVAALARKANIDAARRALRLSAKAQKAADAAAAAAAAAAEAASAAGPSTVNNHNTINLTINNNYSAPPVDERSRSLRQAGDIRGFFSK